MPPDESGYSPGWIGADLPLDEQLAIAAWNALSAGGLVDLDAQGKAKVNAGPVLSKPANWLFGPLADAIHRAAGGERGVWAVPEATFGPGGPTALNYRLTPATADLIGTTAMLAPAAGRALSAVGEMPSVFMRGLEDATVRGLPGAFGTRGLAGVMFPQSEDYQ
jgi:hypothetical protein